MTILALLAILCAILIFMPARFRCPSCGNEQKVETTLKPTTINGRQATIREHRTSCPVCDHR